MELEAEGDSLETSTGRPRRDATGESGVLGGACWGNVGWQVVGSPLALPPKCSCFGAAPAHRNTRAATRD